jgi:pimeloyl-ACP methyl ester carboxylesterase
MPHVQVDGIAIAYNEFGAGDPVVFIHGAFIADAFRPLLDQSSLSNRYQLITYHRRGYGGSSRVEGPISCERQAADCQAVLQALRIARAHVVGHSFGGSIALQLARQAPNVVASLVLLEPALFTGASAASYRESLMRSSQTYVQRGAATVMEEFFRARWPAYSRAELERVLPGSFERAVADAGTTLEVDIGLVDWAFGPEHARRIAQPTLVVLGGGSEALHPRFGETYRSLLDWLPHAEGLVVPDATHFFQLESSDIAGWLGNALVEFFAQHPLPQ